MKKVKNGHPGNIGLLLDYTARADIYRTAEKSLILHAIIKFGRLKNILEVGAGMGISTFWMASALRDLGKGQLLSFDDASQWPSSSRALSLLRSHDVFRPVAVKVLEKGRAWRRRSNYLPFMRSIARTLGVERNLTLISRRVDFMKPKVTSALSLPKDLDLVFLDYRSGMLSVIRTLPSLLPYLNETAYVAFDSESTWNPSFLAMERTVAQLDAGKIPAAFLAGRDKRARDAMARDLARRTFRLMHFVADADHSQNSLMLIKVEPANIFPYPLAGTRGLMEGPATRRELDDFFR